MRRLIGSLRVIGPLRGAAITLAVAGLVLLADAGLTLVWKEPISSLYAQVRQDQLSSDLATLERALPSPLEVTALARLRSEPARLNYLARELRDTARSGAAIARIRIPRIGLDMVVVNGTDLADLREGPGIYEQTGFPGTGGTTAIAGHRTTYLAPFRHIDRLRSGDQISVDMPYGRFVYRVTGETIVKPTDVAVLGQRGYSRLVLSACTPLFSAAERLIVFARLARVDPLGPARVA